MKLLLIDDDSLAHEIVDLYIHRYTKERNLDLHIKALHDPVQALLEISTHGDDYDIILLDLGLPKLGGDEIYHSIAHKMPQLLNRIIFITASPHKLHQKLPGHDLCVLGKPYRYEMFEYMIDHICPDASQESEESGTINNACTPK